MKSIKRYVRELREYFKWMDTLDKAAFVLALCFVLIAFYIITK